MCSGSGLLRARQNDVSEVRITWENASACSCGDFLFFWKSGDRVTRNGTTGVAGVNTSQGKGEAAAGSRPQEWNADGVPWSSVDVSGAFPEGCAEKARLLRSNFPLRTLAMKISHRQIFRMQILRSTNLRRSISSERRCRERISTTAILTGADWWSGPHDVSFAVRT